ncbi:MAG: hypothetical protein JW963_16190 [Anaerolineales bacterium]|nr:hypothetical protein [Anaerolineales bacterium]
MNHSKATVDRYRKLYADLRFERGDLFELIQEQYHPTEVLYPGCSIHITPAFFFPHVIFIDKNPEAADFFSHRKIILDLIKRCRKYRRTPYIQFVSQDFTKLLPVLENQFDLVLALFTGGVSLACKPYLKMGGLIVTNNHQNDAVEASQDSELALIAVIQKHREKYRLTHANSSKPLKIKSQGSQSKQYLRQTTSGVEYIENESYYVFERVRLRQ